MKLNQTFNANDLPQGGGGFEPLPAGWYMARVTDAETRATKAGTGEYISVRYDITGPTHQGRVVYGNLNISNPSAKAEQIGRQQLGELMRAIGLAKISDTDQLVGGVCELKITIRKGNDQYPDSNDIQAWKAVSSGPPASVAADAVTQQKQSPPWVKK